MVAEMEACIMADFNRIADAASKSENMTEKNWARVGRAILNEISMSYFGVPESMSWGDGNKRARTMLKEGTIFNIRKREND